jgi:hypothetical protein
MFSHPNGIGSHTERKEAVTLGRQIKSSWIVKRAGQRDNRYYKSRKELGGSGRPEM